MAVQYTKLSQKDYLRKYLGGGGDGKKRKKKDKSTVAPASTKCNIIDDDVDVSQLRPLDASELDVCDPAEDAPQVAGIIDERPAELRVKEQYTTQKWKVLTDPVMGDVQGVIETGIDSDRSELKRKKRQRERSPDEAVLLAREAKRLEEIREQEFEKHRKNDKHRKDKKHKSKESSHRKTALSDDDKYDKTVLQKEMEREREELFAKEEEQKKHLEKYQKWGKGVKQLENSKERLLEMEHEMEKPLARYADDEDLDRHLREQEREGDPMLEYMRSKKSKKKDKSKSAKPVYQGPYPPNRYNIPPGHRWDGVDRSSGYEKKWFETQNARKADEELAYKWGSEDL